MTIPIYSDLMITWPCDHYKQYHNGYLTKTSFTIVYHSTLSVISHWLYSAHLHILFQQRVCLSIQWLHDYGLTVLNLGRFLPLTVLIPCISFRNYKSIDSQIIQFIYHSNWNISNFKIYNFEHIFCILFFVFSGRAKYVHQHTSSLHFCIQIITDHFLLSKVSHPIHTIPGINAQLLYPILCPWKYSIRHKLLYCSVRIFGCFHGNQCCVAS